MENLSSPIFFILISRTLQSDGIRQWPYLPALAPSVSPQAVPTFQIRKRKQRGCDHFLEITHLKGGTAEISKSPSVLGCNTRASGAADACLVFFCAKSSARGWKQMRFSTAFPSPPVCSTSSLTHNSILGLVSLP